ncbi:TadE/TadG family type IV pilus assembly protein [Rhabdothermincola salaria]|uniref:TadE/TadG family type IV pilus assembly protein n=1 Tax=Rhabdothermincola salaria TaxID=2903142 RepID=UPI001E381015|nr:pilus assembly protein [Rhabdothermincola salaria]
MARREGRGSARAFAGTPADGGQATVELAMVLPLVALVVLLVLQVGLVLRDQVMVVHAAREAARAAVVAEAANDRAGSAARAARLSGSFHPDETEVSTRLLDGGRRLEATVRHVNRTDVPLVGLLLPDVGLEARTVMRVEHPD